jgi:hypothetical protein
MDKIKNILNKKVKTGIEESLSEIKKGNIYKAKDSKDLISKCVK